MAKHADKRRAARPTYRAKDLVMLSSHAIKTKRPSNTLEVRKDLQAEKTKQNQKNMPLRMSKKGSFGRLAALPEFGGSEQDSSRAQADENTPGGQTKNRDLKLSGMRREIFEKERQ